MPKVTTRFYERHIMSTIKIFSKSRFMSTHIKSSCLMKVITDQSKIVHSLRQIEMSRLAKDLVFTHALENEDILTDALLHCKTFYGNKTRFKVFWDFLKEIIIEQSIAEEKRHHECCYRYDSLSISHCR